MKSVLFFGVGLIVSSLLGTSCKKKESGVCYCSYFKGDKKEYNLTSLPRSAQIDSCYTLDRLASNFAGSCKLK